MPTPEEKQRLAQLEAKLDAAKKRNAPKPRVDKTVDESHLAWRMVIELVVGLLIGFGIGFGLDTLFGTLPIFLMLFTLLGLAAGIKTMLRSAQELQNKQLAAQADKISAPAGVQDDKISAPASVQDDKISAPAGAQGNDTPQGAEDRGA